MLFSTWSSKWYNYLNALCSFIRLHPTSNKVGYSDFHMNVRPFISSFLYLNDTDFSLHSKISILLPMPHRNMMHISKSPYSYHTPFITSAIKFMV